MKPPTMMLMPSLSFATAASMLINFDISGLQEQSVALAGAATEGRRGATFAAAVQLVGEVDDQACAGLANRVAERDRRRRGC